jgi:carbon-monoxide dehydrogenase iron sulfur subunit
VKRILVNKDLCSGCRACEVACVAWHDGRFGTATARIRVTKIEPLGVDCPFGMADLYPETGMALICDLCGGDPDCVKRCATGAIVYAETGARAKREDLAVKASGETPE